MCIFGVSMSRIFLGITAFAVFCLPYCRGKPAKRELIDDNVQSYLTRFGYMSRAGLDGAGALRTEESIRHAIKELQKFSGLPVTGRIDSRTRKLLQTPRCGLPDDANHFVSARWRRKRFTVQGQKWMYTNLTWSLRSKNLRSLNSDEVRYVIAKALEVWSTHSKLTFTEVDSDRADILVYFHRGDHGDNFPFDGKGQVLAHAFFPGGGRGGDAHFDEDELWLTKEFADNEDGTSLFHVAAHEFGHSLGLSHSPVEGALMYPWYQGKENGFNYSLPEDDRLGIQSLYGVNEDRLWGPIPPFKPHSTTTTSTTPTTKRTSSTVRTFPPVYGPKNGHPRYPSTRKPKYPTKWNRKHKYPFRTTQKSHTTVVPTTTARTYTSKEYSFPPDTCDTTYDAVAVIRREVFIFKDEYFWRIGDEGLKYKDYPAKITRLWHELPKNFTHIDAVYERTDGRIVFFIGKLFYVFMTDRLEPNYPRPLSHLGLPPTLDRLDGALVWGHNGKTYFYSANKYWAFDEETQKVEWDYPRDMSMWRGVKTPIDAVFQWKDGKTYFFKGKKFWKFNDLRMRVENDEPLPSAPFWMGCTKNFEGGHVPLNDMPRVEILQNSSKATDMWVCSLLFFMAVFVGLVRF